MTHDELVVKMNKEVEMAEFESACGDGNDPRIAKALLAVVELHYPKLYPDWVPTKDNEHCNRCAGPYPCPTIQAIEKELQ
jgi:hypothetical protein